MSGEVGQILGGKILRRRPCSVISGDIESLHMKTETGPLDLTRSSSVTWKITTVSKVAEVGLRFHWSKGKNEGGKEIIAGSRNQGRVR